MRRNIVVVDTSGRKEHNHEALSKISRLPVVIRLMPCVNEEEFISACETADIILLAACRITAAALDKLPRLKGVVRYGTGLDVIDVEACTRRGVQVRNVRGFCTDELADHALALCLSLTRQVTLSAERSRKGIWRLSQEYPVFSLRGRTAGIIGTGHAGRAVSLRLKAFGARVLGFDPFYSGDDTIQMSPLERLLRESDVVFLHCPLSKDTFHMLGEKQFSLMKNTAYLVNASRGGVVDENALIEALKGKKIAGAGLDVLEEEPPGRRNPLLSMENVIITPHSGAYSKESFARLELKVFEQVAELVDWIAGA